MKRTEQGRMECDTIDYRDVGQLQRRYIDRNRPVVIRGARHCRDAAIFDWSGDVLRRAFGSREVPIIESDSPYLSYERNVSPMPFDRFIERLSNADDSAYLYYKNSTELLPPGLDDSERLTELAAYMRLSVMRNLWISGADLTVGLHFDPAENLNIQLRGRKRFTLHPPGIGRFYPMPMFSQSGHVSRVFREGPTLDAARFPRFDPSSSIEVMLEEGDILYLPTYWWHRVESLGAENINLNFWWLPKLRKQLSHPNQALRGYIGLLIRRLKFGSIATAEKAKES